MNRTKTLPCLLSAAILAAGCGSTPSSDGSAPPGSPPPPAATPAPSSTSGASPVYSAGQAERGRGAFRTSCAECHYSSEFRGTQFQYAWGRRSVGDLYREIVNNMPEDDPGSLEPGVYVDIVAYILQLNGFPAGAAELPADEAALDAYSMAAPPGPGPDREAP